MDAPRTGVFVLFVLLVPVSSDEIFFTDPVVCYFLDSILIVYCIVATALFFREKFYIPPVGGPAENGIYQELQRPKDTDPYQELELSKVNKKADKKKKSGSAQAVVRDPDPFESLIPSGTAPPPVSPH
ncbi:T-cell surface glycoprotein CD3 zeta chain-like [Cebidichthys violaceus]|uniref:T-cell surface glycoprotein CD3 zeta chain-like n=1 Tax=Cebidichthys violaceus TaxID=271503 RepID=UPI0035CA7435